MIQTQLWFNQGHYPPSLPNKKKRKNSQHIRKILKTVKTGDAKGSRMSNKDCYKNRKCT